MTVQLMIRQLITQVRAAEDDSRTLIFRGTTESIASDGGILRARGMVKDRFKANPVVKWNHGDEVIGKTTKLVYEADAKAWDFHVHFVEPDIDGGFADSRYRMAKAGYLRAVSVGFQILEMEDLSDQQREKLGLDRYGWVAKRWELHELSLVPVGADPLALKRSIDAGEFTQKDMDMQPIRVLPTVRPLVVIDSERDDDTAAPITPPVTPSPERGDQTREAIEANTRALQEQSRAMAALTEAIEDLRESVTESGPAPVAGHEPERKHETQREDTEAAEIKARMDAFFAKHGVAK